MNDKIEIFINDEKVAECEPQTLELPISNNLDKGDIPYEVYVFGQPIRDTTGNPFMTTDNKMKQRYADGKFLVVMEGKLSKEETI